MCSNNLVTEEVKLRNLRSRIVYVPFNVERLAQEMTLEFDIGSGTLALWNMEINQIECSHKAALVTPDERQGFLSIIF